MVPIHFYSDGANNDLDPEVTMYVGDLSNYVIDSDDNSYVGHGYNFGLKTYLQKGRIIFSRCLSEMEKKGR